MIWNWIHSLHTPGQPGTRRLCLLPFAAKVKWKKINKWNDSNNNDDKSDYVIGVSRPGSLSRNASVTIPKPKRDESEW